MASAQGDIRVAIVDDHPIAHDGVRILVDQTPGMRVTMIATNAAMALGALAVLDVDVCLLDLALSGAASLTLLCTIVERHPAVRVIAFTGASEAQYGVACIRSGATGFVTKQSRTKELLDAIRAAHRGERAVSPALAAELAGEVEEA